VEVFGWCRPRLFLLALLLAVWPSPGWTHDASAWGGLFRSRDHGRSWFQANQGRPIGGALSIAVQPADSNYLLLGTDAGLLASRNGGLDWEQQAPTTLTGAVLAVAIDPAGGRALAATERAIFRSNDLQDWQSSPTPVGASPARSIVPGPRSGQAYLLGWQHLYRTADWGASWIAVSADLPESPVTALAVARDGVFAVVAGEAWASFDDGVSWERRDLGLPVGTVQALGYVDSTVWAAGADRVFRSTDRGLTWTPVGQPLDEQGTEIRGLAADSAGSDIVLSTHRGLYATRDGGASWSLLADNLPAHLEAGPLLADQTQSGVLYAGFALLPYTEQWARAAGGRSAAGQLSLSEVAGAAAFLALLGLAAGGALQWLARRRTRLVQVSGGT
jgi:photosystem II stability/assembly factor-like uncharacterized protein